MREGGGQGENRHGTGYECVYTCKYMDKINMQYTNKIKTVELCDKIRCMYK